MIVNAMTAPAIRPEEKDRNGAEKTVSVAAFRSSSRQWQSRLLVAVVLPVCAALATWYAAGTWTRLTRIALAFSLLFGVAAWLARAATPSAAVAGGILAAAMTLAGGGSGGMGWLRSPLLPLLALFLLTFAATRFGKLRKQRSAAVHDLAPGPAGVPAQNLVPNSAPDARGRSAAQVAANLGTAGLLGSCILAFSLLERTAHGNVTSPSAARLAHRTALCTAMLIAALGEATADTVSSELGEVLGGTPRLITTGRRVLPGTDGAVSLAGTLAGLAGGAVIVLVGVPTTGLSLRAALAAMGGATGGFFFDSVLGATAERKGWLNNDAVNFLSTLAAALLALAIA